MSELLADDPEWAGVVPVRQYENVNPIAPIFYSEEYKDATDYFRAVVKTGEMSPRVLKLTETIIQMNPAHYTAWQHRYKTLIALKSDLEEELRLMDDIAKQFMKTYQVWHHRRLLLTAINSVDVAALELEFLRDVLEADSKNYHTWSYRQWILAHFNNEARLWARERGYAETLLDADVRNNSAWHHRFFVVFASGVRLGDEDREQVRRRELAYVKEQIAVAPNNASAWNYLRGVLETTRTPFEELTSFVEPYTASQRPAPGEEVVDLDNPLPTERAELPCVAALEFMADAYEKRGGDSVPKAVEIWKVLANEKDTMRKKYWEYRIRDALQHS
ncbi:protein prenylyltransferase [Trametes versicolor FP-101664 SS1]|uniref:protein prenylyltransferase n=1 Tax=Trametes versicolor (strain FP-101664) TaxID=717944 RepID=UPI0004622C97|nr:protein prenylyltransferase [Trametes versicolor FP-101664 SS1]EIW54989.1 protein prenylyltransferase [Trametes versicolor FP-101664 SS1]